jgi:hypothetical protein
MHWLITGPLLVAAFFGFLGVVLLVVWLKSEIDKFTRRKNPDWNDLLGIAPDATGDLSSEQFVRNLRDEWPDCGEGE